MTTSSAATALTREPDEEFARDLAWALEDANLPTVLSVLVHLTRDRGYLDGKFAVGTLRGPGDHDDAGLPPETQAELRRVALEVILAHLRGELPEQPPPTPSEVVEILSRTIDDDVPADQAGLLAEELGLVSRTPTPLAPDALPTALPSLIVGTGFSGLAAAIRFQQAGLPFTIIDKNDGVGGTWHENTYPGCGVDTPVHLYSFAFAQRPGWPAYFAGQTEVRNYLKQVADEHHITDRVRYGTELVAADWDEERQVWKTTLKLEDGSSVHEDYPVIISSVGQFNRPKTPDIAGLDTFEGPVVHTAQWDPTLDLTGKRIAVVGSGASAMQFVPAVREKAGHVTVYQRSPQWILPNPNAGVAVSEQKRFLMAHVPWYLGWYRLRQAWNFGDRMHRLLRIDPEWQPADRSINADNEKHRQFLTRYITRQLEGRPDLLEKCVPDYPVYGKRPLLDHGWFESLKADNVSLVAESVTSVGPRTVTSTSGATVEVDVIVLATGFDVINMLGPLELTGRDGTALTKYWGQDDARAHLGMTVPGFPNFFMLFGPNTNAGHGGSLVMTVEMQVRYLIELLNHMACHGLGAAEVKQEPFDKFNLELDEALSYAVWSHPGMSTYYRNSAGRIVTNLPWTNAEYWHRVRHVALEDFEFTPADDREVEA